MGVKLANSPVFGTSVLLGSGCLQLWRDRMVGTFGLRPSLVSTSDPYQCRVLTSNFQAHAPSAKKMRCLLAGKYLFVNSLAFLPYVRKFGECSPLITRFVNSYAAHFPGLKSRQGGEGTAGSYPKPKSLPSLPTLPHPVPLRCDSANSAVFAFPCLPLSP